MPTPELLGTVASIITAASVAALFFRIQRELTLRDRQRQNWIAHADWLLIVASLVAVFLVLVPLLVWFEDEGAGRRLPTAACAASAVALGGYPLAILAHYRLILGTVGAGKAPKPGEPAENAIVLITAVLAAAAFVWSLSTTA